MTTLVAKTTEDTTDYKSLYMELIMQITQTYPGKTCHEIALMRIKHFENQNNSPECAKGI